MDFYICKHMAILICLQTFDIIVLYLAVWPTLLYAAMVGWSWNYKTQNSFCCYCVSGPRTTEEMDP